MSGITEREFEVVGTLTDDCRFIEIAHYKPLARILGRLKGEELSVKFRKLFYRRSDAQNRYIWGIVVPTVMTWHYETQGTKVSKDAVYTWLRTSLLGHTVEVSEVLGKEVLTMGGKRFSKMSTKEFAEAIDTIVDEMAKVGCIIPLPKKHNFLTEFIDE